MNFYSWIADTSAGVAWVGQWWIGDELISSDCTQILRVVADGDKCDVIYLPPHNAGDKLPVELLDAYEGHCSLNCFVLLLLLWTSEFPVVWFNFLLLLMFVFVETDIPLEIILISSSLVVFFFPDHIALIDLSKICRSFSPLRPIRSKCTAFFFSDQISQIDLILLRAKRPSI